MANPIFELYDANGVLQLDLASGLIQTLGVINTNDYPLVGNDRTGSVYIPQFETQRGWFSYQGFTWQTAVNCPYIAIVNKHIEFRIRGGYGAQIKYGTY